MANVRHTVERLRGLYKGWQQPGARIKSAWLHARHPHLSDLWISWDTKLDLEDGARLELEGDLTLGFYKKADRTRTPPGEDPGPIGPPIYRRAVLGMAFDGLLRTTGPAFVGPGCRLVIGERATLEIGSGTYFTGDATVLARRSITIGKDCAIGWQAMIMDSDMHFLEVDGEWRSDTAPVKIEDRVWVGSDVRILKGVTIGEGAVIATGAVVTKDVEPATVVGGVPAIVLRKNVKWY